jgi:hypothetical protein
MHTRRTNRALVLAAAGCLSVVALGGTASAADLAPTHHAVAQKHPHHKLKNNDQSGSSKAAPGTGSTAPGGSAPGGTAPGGGTPGGSAPGAPSGPSSGGTGPGTGGGQ